MLNEIVRVVDAYLSGRLCAADRRLWLRRREEMGASGSSTAALTLPLPHLDNLVQRVGW
jgi:hypothetical protein